MHLIRKLQADAVDPNIPVSNLLRTAKIVTSKLVLTDALVWIDRELNGYMDLTPEELPPYRRLQGEPQAFYAYHGWQPISCPDSEFVRRLSQAPIWEALGALERSLGENSKLQYYYPYPPRIKSDLLKELTFATDVCIHLTYGHLCNIIEQVRNLILNWSLDLEKAGITGDDMTFTAEEKREAGSVTQHFIIQNVGVLGDVSDQARVTNQQTALATMDLGKVQDFVTQARSALHLLPTATREQMAPVLDEVESELKAPAPDTSKLARLLRSARAICEGAAGNLTAEGILQLLRRLVQG